MNSSSPRPVVWAVMTAWRSSPLMLWTSTTASQRMRSPRETIVRSSSSVRRSAGRPKASRAMPSGFAAGTTATTWRERVSAAASETSHRSTAGPTARLPSSFPWRPQTTSAACLSSSPPSGPVTKTARTGRPSSEDPISSILAHAAWSATKRSIPRSSSSYDGKPPPPIASPFPAPARRRRYASPKLTQHEPSHGSTHSARHASGAARLPSL